MPQNKNLKWGYYTFEIEWKYDEDPDVSYLVGKCTDNRDEYVFDRREGLLLGEYVEKTLTLKYSRIPGRKMVEDVYSRSGKSPSGETWAYAEKYFEDKAQAAGLAFDDEFDVAYEVRWDTDEKEFYLELSGYAILAQDLGHHINRNNEYRYVYASENHLPHNPKNWSHVSPESMDGESFEAADIRYAVEDYERWERFISDWWCMLGCVVTVYKDGVEISHDSLWGIESDSDKSYFAEVEEGCLSEALHYANIGLPAKTILEEAEAWETA